ETGYLAGQNIAIEFRFSDGQDDQLPALAAELVRRRVAVLVATGRPSALAAKAATATIPIVFTSGADAVEISLLGSLNRPRGNATGVNIFTTELGPKRLELHRQLLPNAGTIAFIVNPNSATTGRQVSELQTAAAALGQQILVLNAGSEKDRRSLRDHRRAPRCCRPLSNQSVLSSPTGATCRVGRPALDPGNVRMARVRYGRRPNELQYQSGGSVSPDRNLHRARAQGRESGRLASHAVDQVRVRDQPQDCQGARHQNIR